MGEHANFYDAAAAACNTIAAGAPAWAARRGKTWVVVGAAPNPNDAWQRLWSSLIARAQADVDSLKFFSRTLDALARAGNLDAKAALADIRFREGGIDSLATFFAKAETTHFTAYPHDVDDPHAVPPFEK